MQSLTARVDGLEGHDQGLQLNANTPQAQPSGLAVLLVHIASEAWIKFISDIFDISRPKETQHQVQCAGNMMYFNVPGMQLIYRRN